MTTATSAPDTEAPPQEGTGFRPRRSCLAVPGSNPRFLEKAQGLPAGWTPEQATETLAALEASAPAIKQALDELETAQVALDARVTAFDYRLQSMAAELGVPAASLAAEARAILAENPAATEAEVADAMGVSVGSVKTHLHRGLASLATRVGEER